MTTYKRGEVVLVPFPFTDLSSAKQRPALVVSPDAWNASQSDVMLVALTSQIPASIPSGDILLTLEDLRSGGLPKPTLGRPTKLVTIHQALIRKRLGEISDATLTQVLLKLRDFFG
ncbi:MAG TPA: type II toxin-antitoxin system PemK/MazF family toxin [Opitutaceae bacterium]|nr:type II toxin-antitoxin system PemK/MazF family toxin [Opitutaceae bacterium]